MVAFSAGCIMVPTPPIGINEIPADRLKLVRTGTTKRVDVLMTFGDPDERHLEDRVFVYRWDRFRTFGVAMGGGVGGIKDHFAFVIEFDAEGRVASSGNLSAFTNKGFQEELDLRLRDIRASTGMTDEVTAAPMATNAAVASLAGAPGSELAPITWFDGAARWFPGRPAGASGFAPAQGVTGRLVVSTDGIVFFARLGTVGFEAPLRVAREAIVRAECGLSSLAILRTDGTREHFEGLRAADDTYDYAMTMHLCRLVDAFLKQGPQ
jgi:hypothetical protein